MTATAANGKATHVTHSRCAESGRCSAWGRMPSADQRDRQQHGRPSAAAGGDGSTRRTRAWPPYRRASRRTTGTRSATPTAPGGRHHGGISSATACRPPSRRSHEGGRGSSRPSRRWSTGSSTIPSNAATGPAITRWTHIGSSPTSPPASSGFQLARCVHTNHPSDQRDGDHQVRAERQRQPGQHPATTQQRRAAGGSVTETPRTANTVAHSVSASPPFHAIAVSAIGVST